MICEYFLASGVDSGIGGRNVAGRCVAGVGGIILGRVSHGGVWEREREKEGVKCK
jgi:hypothetical protein